VHLLAYILGTNSFPITEERGLIGMDMGWNKGREERMKEVGSQGV